MKRRPRSQKLVSEINITPFTDVILVLLIIFMVATPLIFHSSVKIQLPQSSSRQDPIEKPQDINITINGKGEVFLENNLYSLRFDLEVLKFKLSSLAKKSKDPSIIISADKEVRYDFVMKVIDLATQVGFQRVVLALEVKPCTAGSCP